ncbi:hypothetical protein B1757_11610 [Acidithiobacillus marinus]|uniref:Uncharacterized protein n=1 Tax=Acidithiobacillus marinus TaxID=187490 RepID=A0A2I1DJ90_9PROT|nr:hypothetical protein B1757_11610 [Acidithiobacillus marinus]
MGFSRIPPLTIINISVSDFIRDTNPYFQLHYEVAEYQTDDVVMGQTLEQVNGERSASNKPVPPLPIIWLRLGGVLR